MLLTGSSNLFSSILSSAWRDLDKVLVGFTDTERLLISVNLGRSLSDTNHNLSLTGILDLVLIFLEADDAAASTPITWPFLLDLVVLRFTCLGATGSFVLIGISSGATYIVLVMVVGLSSSYSVSITFLTLWVAGYSDFTVLVIWGSTSFCGLGLWSWDGPLHSWSWGGTLYFFGDSILAFLDVTLKSILSFSPLISSFCHSNMSLFSFGLKRLAIWPGLCCRCSISFSDAVSLLRTLWLSWSYSILSVPCQCSYHLSCLLCHLLPLYSQWSLFNLGSN